MSEGIINEGGAKPRLCAAIRALWDALAILRLAHYASHDALDAWLQGRISPHRTSLFNLTTPQLVETIGLLQEWMKTGKCPPKGKLEGGQI